MEITFRDSNLQKLCEKQAKAQKQLGAPCAKKLQTRLAQLMAASRVGDLCAGHPHPLKGDRAGEFAVSLEGGVRLVFKPSNAPIPRTADGAIDWPNVTEVCIVFIGDYHD